MAKKSNSKSKISRSQLAYNGIRSMLFHNEIAPGQKISYQDLANRFNMSPTPVIQALNRMEHQGLVRRADNRGYYTEPISKKQVEEVYELRQNIEISIIPKVIKNLSPENLKHLRAALDAYQNASKDIFLSDRLVKDMEFHITIASISQSDTHVQVLRQMFDLLYLRNRGSMLFSIPTKTVDKEHIILFEAIKNKDVKKAQDVLEKHIENKKKLVLDGLCKMIADKKEHVF